MRIEIMKLRPEAVIPSRACGGDAGYDLFPVGTHTIYPGQRLIVPTGLAMAIPAGYYGRIAERSGRGAFGLAVGAGVIDSGYRGEIGIVLRNLRFFNDIGKDDDPQLFFNFDNVSSPITINPEKAIAQIIFEKCHSATFWEVFMLEQSARGEDGWGSSDRR